MKRTYFCGNLSKEQIDQQVILAGWVKKRRDHGGLIFIDLSDKSGVVQIVFNPELNREAHKQAHDLREGWVISVNGKVAQRPQDSINPKIATGDIEVVAENLEVLNVSSPLPFSIEDDIDAAEEVRLKYRYLDLRRPIMQRNLKLRYRVTRLVRDFLDKRGFIEVETPFLTKSTPEGARDYLVPSRLNPGEFYALPQSPQLFKQLIMVAGFDRYFQIVRCFRDEDLRADRQPEHTQIDIELSFIEEEDIFELVEGMLGVIFKKTLNVTLPSNFPRLTYEEAMDRYGSDKPDIRFGMELKNLSFLAQGSKFKVFSQVVKEGGQIKGIALQGGASLSRKDLDELNSWVSVYQAKGLSWILLTETGVKSPILKFFSPQDIEKVISETGAKKGDAIFIIADKKEGVNESLGQLRLYLAKKFNLIPEDTYQPLWVVDFPLFEKDEQGRLSPLHHPFTSPQRKDIPILESFPEKVKSRAYDIVLNGEEIGGGSIRIHQRKLQERILEMLGISKLQQKEKFGFLLDALSFGAPPHGGIALGLDRLVMILAGEKSIREVIPFPKTQRGICLLTQAPSLVEKEQLKELHIEISEE